MRKRISTFNSLISALFFIFVTLGSAFSLYIPKSATVSEDILVIPKEAIRLRILANSNSEQDQEIKRKVRDRVNQQITEWVSDLTSIEEARHTIVEHLDEIEMLARNVLEEEGVSHSLQVEFEKVQFPTKLYGNFLYPAGEYEAILITIGEGVGANWWCVLFPPLCFLDFSSGSAVSPGFEEDSEDDEDLELEEEIAEEELAEDEEQVETESVSAEASQELFVEEEEPEVKFFVVELFNKLLSLF